MGYTSKHKGAKIDALLDKVEALPEGGGEGGSAPMMIEVTWEELVALRDAANLTAGQMYRITDYETMTSKEGSQAAGHPFDVIVTALDNKTLDEKASAIWSARDTEGYFADSNLHAWDVKYCLDNDTSRFDWAVAKGKTLIIDGSSTNIGEVSVVMNGTFEYEGTTYFKWPASVEGMEVYFLTASDSPSIGDVVIPYLPSLSMTFPNVTVKAVEEKTIAGKGVIYYMRDENENDAPYDFKNILFLRKVRSDGIIDNENGEDMYVYTFSEWKDGIIKDASGGCMINHIGEKCWDNVFLGISPLAMFIANEITSGSLSNSFGSSCLQNRIVGGSSNTFGSLCISNYLRDSSRNTIGDSASDNRLAESCVENTVKGSRNVFENSCKRNLVSGSFNTFGTSCEDNQLKSQCHDNIFYAECKSNVLEYMDTRNVFGTQCSSNTLGEECCDNVFHTQCENNVLGKNSWYNTFGIYCKNNNFGGNTQNVVLGNVCSNNKFATTSAGDVIASYFQNIEFGGRCSNLTLWCAQATSSSKMVRNIKIAAGLSSSAIEIPVLGANYVQTVAKNSSGEVKVYCEADLVQ